MTTPTDATLIENARPFGAPTVDILIDAGIVRAVRTGLKAPKGAASIDAAGAIALPGFVNAHCHLDKTRFGLSWRPHAAGAERRSRIDADRTLRREMISTTGARARALAMHAYSLGTTHMRSHVDVEPEFGLAAVEALLELRQDLGGAPAIELVAFPQFGLVTNPGTADLMEEACRLGCECVGGIDPSAIDGDAAAHLDAVFGIAERTGAGIDIHLHEAGEEGAKSMEMICERTRALGLQGRVAVSHAFCLGTVAEVRQGALIEGLARSGVAVVTYAPGKAPVPPLKELRAAGVTLAAGTDGIRDAWTPYGNADMLERAMMLAYRLDYRRDDDIVLALDAMIAGGAALMGLSDHGLETGSAGPVVLVEAETPAEAVVVRPPRRIVS